VRVIGWKSIDDRPARCPPSSVRRKSEAYCRH
jgi:hypothetical protein